MLDAWSDLDATRSIQVAVLVMGQTPSEGMEKYLTILKRNRRYDLATITLPAHSPFRNVSRQTDYVLLNYRDRLCPTAGSSWESIFVWRRVLAVIGLVHCPSNPDLDVPYEEFQSALKAFPSALQTRCLAFEPLDSQQDLIERQNLVMVPNSDADHLQFYVHTLVMDVIERLVCDLLDAGRALSLSQEFPYIPFDKPVLQHDPGKRKRFLPGRIAKLSADYSLLCGIVAEARDLYQVSIESTKSSGDYIWRGAALEGLACCEAFAPYEARVALLTKAIRNYSKRPGTQVLRIEAFLKLARFAAAQSRIADSLEYVSRAYELCSSASLAEKTAVVIESAILCHWQGARRKFAMFMREAALLHAQRRQWQRAYQSALLCAPVYVTWPALHVAVLAELATAASVLNLMATKCAYLATILTKVGSAAHQAAIASDLSASAVLIPRNHQVGMAGIIVAKSVKMAGMDEGLVARARAGPAEVTTPVSEQSDEDVFLFRPSSSSEATGSDSGRSPRATRLVQAAVGQILHFDLILQNPLQIDLMVECMALRCEGVEYQSFPMPIGLSGGGEQVVRLAVMPLSSGILTIHQLLIRLWNIDSYHDLDKMMSWPICIAVCEPLPFLQLDMYESRQFFFGQITTFPIWLRNTGTVIISDISIQFQDEDGEKSAVFQREQNHEIILHPGENLSVEIAANGHQGTSQPTFAVVAYASEKGAEFYRQISLQIPFRIETGLFIRSIEIYPFAQTVFQGESPKASAQIDLESFGPNDCMIVVEIVNTADQRFNLYLSRNRKLNFEIESCSSEWVLFPFRRQSFGSEMDNVVMALVGIEGEVQKCPEFIHCRDEFIGQLCFRWKAFNANAISEGILSVPSSLITPTHLRYLVPDPFLFQFELTGLQNPHQPPTHTRSISSPVSPCLHSPSFCFPLDYATVDANNRFYPQGEFAEIRVVVSSRISHPLSMLVMVRPSYQTSTGNFDYNIQHRLLWTGSWDYKLGPIDSGESASFSLNVCFLVVGRFMFELVCRCEQPRFPSLEYSCSLPLLIESFDQTMPTTLRYCPH